MTRGVSEVACSTQGKCASGWQRVRRDLRNALWALGLVVSAAAPWSPAQAFALGAEGMASITRAELPPQGRDVLARIENGDTFSHPKDGSVFGNRERLLPKQTRGYYREYTVPTPGLKHRGAKRIVCGGEPKRRPDACYYTEDHYASFRLIAQ